MKNLAKNNSLSNEEWTGMELFGCFGAGQYVVLCPEVTEDGTKYVTLNGASCELDEFIWITDLKEAGNIISEKFGYLEE